MTELSLPQRRGREGSRWVNERPTAEELFSWFETNVTLHDGMEHKDWIGGITLIESTESVTEIAGFDSNNAPILVPEVKHLYFIPYPRVDARVAYFNTYVGWHPEWVSFAFPVPSPQGGDLPLPAGYGLLTTKVGDKQVILVTYTIRYEVLERRGLEWVEQEDADGVTRRYPYGEVVMASPPGTKSVPLFNRWGDVDEHAMMKAQTGAIGRALGLMGMLVIPGTGVASAEDMSDLTTTVAAQSAAAAPPIAPTTFERSDTDDALRSRAKALIEELQRDHPANLMAFQAWARERGYTGGLGALSGVPLKGVVKKLEKALDEAKRQAPVEASVEAQVEVDLSGDNEESNG